MVVPEKGKDESATHLPTSSSFSRITVIGLNPIFWFLGEQFSQGGDHGELAIAGPVTHFRWIESSPHSLPDMAEEEL